MRVDPVVWRLRVSCDVRRISGTDQFDVHWFLKNNENEIIDLGRDEVQETLERELVVFGTQRTDNNTLFDESMLGEYWCQVIVTSTQPNIYLGKSDILVIRDPEDYDAGLRTCNGIISAPTLKCADDIQSSLSVSSSSSCTNPTITEGVQLSSTESMSSSSQHLITQQSTTTSLTENMSSSSQLILSETTPITTEQVTLASATENMSSFSSSSSLTFFYSSSRTSSFSSSLSNSQTNIKTYSSIQITPSNSLSISDDSGLASFYIVIIIATIIIMMLGILLVISCLLIVCIKRKKKGFIMVS